jgi:hypothetical protein
VLLLDARGTTVRLKVARREHDVRPPAMSSSA